jgi:hypothetical protein
LPDAPMRFLFWLYFIGGFFALSFTGCPEYFTDHVVDVVTEGEFIASQTPMTVIQTDEMRVVVKSAAQIYWAVG